MIKNFTFSIFLVSLLACGERSKIGLGLKYSGETSRANLHKCEPTFIIADDRKGHLSLGSYGRLVINSKSSDGNSNETGDVVQWVSEAVNTYYLNSSRFDSSVRKQNFSSSWTLKVKKAYVNSGSASLVGNVVLGLENNLSRENWIFRGRSLITNWVGAKSEMMDALNIALVDSLKKMEKTIEGNCATVKSVSTR